VGYHAGPADGWVRGMKYDEMTTAELRAYAREHYSTIAKLSKREELIRAMRRVDEERERFRREAELRDACTVYRLEIIA